MDTKTALLDCAESAVRSSGYDGFSYAHLAKEVGIRKASIHYHFPTKADLALSLMKRHNVGMHHHLAAIDGTFQSAGQRLQNHIDYYRQALDGGQQLCLCVAFSISTNTLDDAIIAELKAFRTKSIEWLTLVFELASNDKTITNVKSPVNEARACLAILEGAHLASRAEKDVSRFDEALELLLMRIV